MFYVGDSISNNHSQTDAILKGGSILTSSPAGSKLISSIALSTPLSSEQQKKRAAMLFGMILSVNTFMPNHISFSHIITKHGIAWKMIVCL